MSSENESVNIVSHLLRSVLKMKMTVNTFVVPTILPSNWRGDIHLGACHTRVSRLLPFLPPPSDPLIEIA